MVIQATALLMVASTSFAGRRQRPGRAKVCSTTRWRGNDSTPLAVSERLMLGESDCSVVSSGPVLTHRPPQILRHSIGSHTHWFNGEMGVACHGLDLRVAEAACRSWADPDGHSH